MKISNLFPLLILGFVVSTTTTLIPEFRWSPLARDSHESLMMSVQFGEDKDAILLERYNPFPLLNIEESIRCNYHGRLQNDPDSFAAVTGCPEDDSFEVTLLSKKSPEILFEVNKGKVNVVSVPIVKNSRLANKPPSSKIFSNREDKKLLPLPFNMTLPMAILYDSNFQSYTCTQGGPLVYSAKVLTHAQAYFLHPSLGTKVYLRVKDGPRQISGRYKATDQDLNRAQRLVTNSSIHHYSIFGNDTLGGTVGIAYIGTICKSSMRVSIVEAQTGPGDMAWTLAHEMGHAFGMEHDLFKRDCTGIMDYGYPPPIWSKCSRRDFQKYYNTVVNEQGKWCLEEYFNHGPSTTTIPTTTPKKKCIDLKTCKGINIEHCIKYNFKKYCPKICGVC